MLASSSELAGFVPWLGSMGLAAFRAGFLGRLPLAQPATTSDVLALLDWSALQRVLACEPDTLVVARGRLVQEAPPVTSPALREQLARGIGLCVRRAERHCPGLARLAASFEPLGTAHVQLFVTPGGTQGFGWHYDDEDVFIAQTAGVKDYYFRRNTVAADHRAHPAMFSRYPRERSELAMATLVAGDFLYLPARWWHMAISREDSLSISVGVSRHTREESR